MYHVAVATVLCISIYLLYRKWFNFGNEDLNTAAIIDFQKWYRTNNKTQHPFINIVDVIEMEPTVDFQCPLVRHEGRSFNICVYTKQEDRWVSAEMLK